MSGSAQSAGRGTVQDGLFFSPTLGRPWPYRVYLPPGPLPARLPTLYLLHGRGADHTAWTEAGGVAALLDREIGCGRVPPLLVVMPDAGSSWYVDGAEPLESAFFHDFLPHIEGRYPGTPARAGRALAGCSMGGYGALRYLLTHPEHFGAALLLSPAIYDGLPPAESTIPTLPAFGQPFDPARWATLNYPAQLRALPDPTAVFVASGDADRTHGDARCNVEVQAALLHARLRGLGVSSSLRVFPGGHDWSVWRPALVEGLRWLAAGWLPGHGR